MSGPGTEQMAAEIRKRREAQGRTIEDVSDICGLTPVVLQQIESGQRDPALSEVIAIAIALGCDARDLFASLTDVMRSDAPAIPAMPAPSSRGRRQ